MSRRPGCIHCGHPFDKQEVTFYYLQGWRVHKDCWMLAGKAEGGHQLKGCVPCWTEGNSGKETTS